MNESLSPLAKWLDSDFFLMGAFITSVDGETITFGKGGEISKATRFLDQSKPVFYLKEFYQDSYLAYTPATILECTREELQDHLDTMASSKLSVKQISNDDDTYKKDFQNLVKAFDNGIEKVVLVSRETFEGFEGTKTIKRLLKKSFEIEAGIPYGLWNKEFGIIGSTPELLYEVDFDELKTFALAGTAKLGDEKRLLDSAKDRHEHNVVIQDIKEKLNKFASEIEVSETKILAFKNIVHLKTDIQAIVDESIDCTNLTNALSPTAALGGYPKVASLEFLKATKYSEMYPQRYFGSGFGLISEDQKEFVVAIRNVQWHGSELFIESGGGVVKESEFKNEMEEIHLKREIIKKHYL